MKTLSIPLALALAAGVSTAQQATVNATVTVGSGTSSSSMTLDSGATGEGATELTRADATAAGLLDANGDPVMTHFEPDPTDPTKPKKSYFRQADGSTIGYALTKPIKIEAKGSDGANCAFSLRLTVICDKTKTGSNLLGKAWLKGVKAIWKFENDEITWPTTDPPPKPPKDKKKNKKSIEIIESATLERLFDGFHGVDFVGADGVATSPVAVSGGNVSLVPASLAASIGAKVVGVVDVADDKELYGLMLKNGFTSDRASTVFDVVALDSIVIPLDDGRIELVGQTALVGDSALDFAVLGRDALLSHDGDWYSDEELVVFGETAPVFPYAKVPGVGARGGHDAEPDLSASGPLTAGTVSTFTVVNADANQPMVLTFGAGAADAVPFGGGVLIPTPIVAVPITSGRNGVATFDVFVPAGLAGLTLDSQAWTPDDDGDNGLSATDGLTLHFQ